MSIRHHQGNQRSNLHSNKQLKNLGKPLSKPAANSLIFIGGIPRIANKQEVLQYVERFGELRYFNMPQKSDTLCHMGFAKVLFVKKENAKEFLDHKNHFIVEKEVGVKEWVPKFNHTPTIEEPSLNKLFIKFTLPASQQQIKDHFMTYGKVSSVVLMHDHVTKKQRDFGFVVFESSNIAQELLKCTNKHMINGMLVQVFPSRGKNDISALKHQLMDSRNGESSQYLSGSITTLQNKNGQEEIGKNLNKKNKKAMHSPHFQAERLKMGYTHWEAEYPTLGPDSLYKKRQFQQSTLKPVRHQVSIQETPNSEQIPRCSMNHHYIKPNSKLWHKDQINQNHLQLNNLVFSLAINRGVTHH